MSAEFRSNLGVFLSALDRAQRAGLVAAAETYMADVKPQLLDGYTSGAYATGNAANSVARTEPERTGDGWEIAVGSTQVNPPYPLYWELGHINIFVLRGGGSVMGGYVRIPIWEPTMVENLPKYQRVMADEVRAVDGAL